MAETVIVNKAELISNVAKTLGLTKKATGQMVNTVIDQIASTLESGGTVKMAGLGTFKVVTRAARNGVNPQTGAKITIEAFNAPAFRYTSSLRDAVREANPVKKAKASKK
jgi:DNA-binding protein HU-beta